MKVYVAEAPSREGTYSCILGVYSTLEKAKQDSVKHPMAKDKPIYFTLRGVK